MQQVVGLLKQTVPMHITAEQLLREVKKAQEELERKQEELKRGQEELKIGQEELKRGQEQVRRMMTELLSMGRRSAHRSDHSSLRASRPRLEYASHNEPALPDQPRTILLRYVHVF
jgi:predicted  nucleic acid-binding Zn-ribbon protein